MAARWVRKVLWLMSLLLLGTNARKSDCKAKAAGVSLQGTAGLQMGRVRRSGKRANLVEDGEEQQLATRPKKKTVVIEDDEDQS
mmetsp:Transcript_11861/g.22974  ORF Transcript_11861/g.22974 Transcript_11861/m.22974 type:complete len:84 (-) Transcript_11861:175-426(-)